MIIVYADPAWHYNSRSPTGTRFGAGASGKYSVMRTDEMAQWPIARAAMARVHKEVALAMWTTGPHSVGGDAHRVMTGWGFIPVSTLFVWVKRNPSGKLFSGTGYYTRSNAEYLLLGRKGRLPRPKKSYIEILEAPHPRDDNKKIIHSRKPAVVRDMLSEMWPGCEQVELFATEQVPGWEGYGYDLGNKVEDFFWSLEVF